MDWGEAQVDLAGTRMTVQVFVMALCYSRRTFVMAFPSQRQEAFLAGHEAAFRFFQGVPHRISYDNLTTAVQTILRGTTRQEQQQFTLFRSYYLFASHFCTPGEPHEKGLVEHRVGFARRNYLVPIPQVDSFTTLNAHLLAMCEQDDARTVHGQAVPIGTAWATEQPHLRPLSAHPVDYAPSTSVRLNPYSQVCFETNHYSVPVDHARPTLIVKARPFQIDILSDQTVIAHHPRCYGQHQDILDPLHYLPLLQQRPGAFAHAKPLRRWRETWPPAYESLLARLQARYPDGGGTREFIQVLDLHRRYPADQVAEAITLALDFGAPNAASVEAILHQLQPSPQPDRPLDLTAQPHLDQVGDHPLNLQQYDALLERS